MRVSYNRGYKNIHTYQLRVNEGSWSHFVPILPLSEFGDRIEVQSVDLECKICVLRACSWIVDPS